MFEGLFLCMGSWFVWTDVSKMSTQKRNSEHGTFCLQLWNMIDLISARQVAKDKLQRCAWDQCILGSQSICCTCTSAGKAANEIQLKLCMPMQRLSPSSFL